MIAIVPGVLFWGSISALAYIYVGYPLILFFLRRTRRHKIAGHTLDARPSPVSVIIAAHNEGAIINRRIANILAQGDTVSEVIVGSDGSTDATVRVASAYPDDRVRVLDFPQRRGRALVHNDCMQSASGEIVIFTDAATEFKPGFITAITGPFADPDVAITTGALMWRSTAGEGMGIHWKLEMMLRRLESDLRLLATASGACMAVRKSCYKRLLPYEDLDDSAPLHAVRSGHRVVHVPGALAVDEEAPSARSEFRARNRMVTQSLACTVRTLLATSPLASPGLWWSALSHKVLRWLTPVFAVAILLAALGPGMGSYREWVLPACGVLGAAVFAGGIGEMLRIRIPGASLAWRLAVANLGMLAGLLQVTRGRRVSSYEPSLSLWQ